MKLFQRILCVLAVIFTSAQAANAYEASYLVMVPDMVCQNCVNHITSELKKVDGVGEVTCQIKAKTFTVQVDTDKVKDTAQLSDAVVAAGYKAPKIEPKP